MFHALQQKSHDTSIVTESFQFDASREFEQLTAAANANRVTFYTVDAMGLRTFTYNDASQQTPGAGAFVDQIHFQNLQAPLQMMAEETGGFAVINTNDFSRGFDKLAGDLDTYYSLGFSPTGVSGRYHRIEVKLKNKTRGVRVRHREGFRDKPPGTRMAESTLAALHYGYAANSHGAAARFWPAEALRRRSAFPGARDRPNPGGGNQLSAVRGSPPGPPAPVGSRLVMAMVGRRLFRSFRFRWRSLPTN